MTPVEFFDEHLDGGSMADAARGTGRSYQTVHAIRHGSGMSAETARRLETWSRTVPAAVEKGVHISAAKTLGVDPDDCDRPSDPGSA